MRNGSPRKPLIERLARVAFTFVIMNYAAVVGAFKALAGRKVWR